MGKIRSLLFAAVVVAAAFGVTGAHATCDAHQSTAGGSTKDCSGDIHCGSNPIATIPVTNSNINVYANQTSNGGELEGCNGTGTGTIQGRAVVKVRTDDPGVRVSLDTDDETPQFPGGYINAQVGQHGTGVWCNQQNEAPNNPNYNLDGYEQPWNKPGTDGGADANAVHCVPTQ